MKTISFKRTAAGKYREFKRNRYYQSSTTVSNETPNYSNTPPNLNNQEANPPSLALLERLKHEWQSNNLNTQWLEGLQALFHALQSEEGKKYRKVLVDGVGKVAKKIPYEKVVNMMAKDQNLSELLKNLGGNGNASDLLSNMMNDPEMRKAAMDMMQEMLSDEKKMEEMTDLMSKVLKSNKE
ncbi:hypothetical protein KGF86_10745 [Ornithinibacillus massiliensis]|uniref:HEAT repeat domain-containing protein n=1 Tax=Ornithinibacillus massiliensis TaxID=1944633 RepID=A0ABS5MEE2_9BACI|nr:hypothetical protein [Ornithinibacillus massiliensis]MBS3680694.1 hypothetical protein [Ornithinibacillus massiliensis]